MFLRLLLLFTLIPLLELYILIKIGSYFGIITTILIVLGTGILGAYLAKQQGFRVWLRIQSGMGQGRFPGNELLDGLLLLVAGIVLITPGLVTDIMGFILLIPATQHMIREWLKNKLTGMMQNGQVRFSGFIR